MARKPTSSILDAVPPSDKDAERSILASLLMDPSRRDEVSAILKPEAFYVEAHRTIYATLLAMGDVDMILLVNRLRTAGDLEEIGGPAYLADVLSSVAIPNHAVHYARIVAETARKREMIHLNKSVLVALYSGKWTAKQLAERQIERLREI